MVQANIFTDRQTHKQTDGQTDCNKCRIKKKLMEKPKTNLYGKNKGEGHVFK